MKCTYALRYALTQVSQKMARRINSWPVGIKSFLFSLFRGKYTEWRVYSHLKKKKTLDGQENKEVFHLLI